MVNQNDDTGADSGSVPSTPTIPQTRTVARVTKYTAGNPTAGLTLDRSAAQQPLGDMQCRVKMTCAPVNPSDVNVLEGTYLTMPDALPAVMGFEGSGVVVQVGPNTKTISVGDHVYARDGAAFNWGSWAEYAVAEEERLLVVSSDCNMELASLMTINPPTAYGLLYGAESGDWVVQNAGNSSAGLSVIQIAKRRGIKTISIVRRKELEADLMAHGADAVVVFDGKSYLAMRRVLAKIMQITNGAKIKLAINAVGGKSAELLAKCLADGGEMLTYGAMSGEPMAVSGAALVFQNLSYKGWHLGRFLASLDQREQDIMFRWLRDAFENDGFTPAKIRKVYPLSKVSAAVADSFQGGSGGKVLMKCSN